MLWMDMIDSLDTAVIVALITGICSVVGNSLLSKSYRTKEEQRREVEEAKVEMRLDNIEKKLDIHNGYAEKFSDISVAMAEISTELKAIKEGILK